MIDSIANIANYTAEQDSTPTPMDEMGKEEFLQLLVAQLRHQDPLNPMQDADFIAQMSQFSSLEQLINMNENLSQSIDMNYMTSQSISNSMATSLLGKTVTADTDMISLPSEGEASINYNLVGAASEVKVSIYSEDGALIQVLYDEYSNAGMNSIEWDGMSMDGKAVPPGHYQVEVEAMSADGSPIGASPFMVGTVEKVQYLDGAAYLSINGSYVMLGDIVEVGS